MYHFSLEIVVKFLYSLKSKTMKRIIILLSLIMIIGCKSKTPTKTVAKSNTKTTKKATPKVEEKEKTVAIEIIPLGSINETQINKAYELGKRVLMTCNTSKFKPFTSEEATEKVIKNTTQDRLTKTCLKFRLKYGDFIDLKLVEAYKVNADTSIVFRYKAIYQKEIANKELQVTLNQEDKVSSIKSLDWNDTFQYK